ncbi:hypothetical protein IH992_34055, partial [Candidatus Poribacteria bacterium]|nr:hypothetical protein [Candidatus Poribacteria bacterium]
MRHRHTQAKRDSQSVLCLTVLTAFALLMSSIQAVEAQGTETFRLEGTVRKVTDGPVGEGFAVEAINQRVPTGWLLELSTNTLDDGTYTIIFFNPIAGLTTNVDDELQITVTDANGNVVGRKTYVVTQEAVDAQGATNVDVILLEPPIATAISPAFGPASGETIVTITGE